jgi:hypothetical protein
MLYASGDTDITLPNSGGVSVDTFYTQNLNPGIYSITCN